MEKSEKNTESFAQTVKRTLITTTIIAIILYFVNIFPHSSQSKPVVFMVTWAAVFCIVFGGHWLELMFINYIKFVLPANMLLLYFTRAIYWFISSVPLFFLAGFVAGLFSPTNRFPGTWPNFGLLYISIQLIMQAITHLRLKKSFYNGAY
jgi:hypothetical protein